MKRVIRLLASLCVAVSMSCVLAPAATANQAVGECWGVYITGLRVTPDRTTFQAPAVYACEPGTIVRVQPSLLVGRKYDPDSNKDGYKAIRPAHEAPLRIESHEFQYGDVPAGAANGETVFVSIIAPDGEVLHVTKYTN